MNYTKHDFLKPLVDKKHSTREMAKILKCSQSTLRRWLKIHKLASKHERVVGEINRTCFTCDKPKKGNRRKLCLSCATSIRRLRLKLALVAYLGGSCTKCPLEANIKSLDMFDFHHKNENKDFNISSTAHSNTWEKLKEEADKCDLLCSNCHRLEHSNKLDKRIKYALDYKGTKKNEEIDSLLQKYR